MELMDVLQWILVSGGGIIIVSWLWNFFGWFPQFDEQKKKMVLFAFSATLTLASKAVLAFVPADVLMIVADWFTPLVMVFVTIFIGEGANKASK
jgi:hypothetical protein